VLSEIFQRIMTKEQVIDLANRVAKQAIREIVYFMTANLTLESFIYVYDRPVAVILAPAFAALEGCISGSGLLRANIIGSWFIDKTRILGYHLVV